MTDEQFRQSQIDSIVDIVRDGREMIYRFPVEGLEPELPLAILWAVSKIGCEASWTPNKAFICADGYLTGSFGEIVVTKPSPVETG